MKFSGHEVLAELVACCTMACLSNLKAASFVQQSSSERRALSKGKPVLHVGQLAKVSGHRIKDRADWGCPGQTSNTCLIYFSWFARCTGFPIDGNDESMSSFYNLVQAIESGQWRRTARTARRTTSSSRYLP